MQTQEVAIKPNLKVVLRSDAQQIDEVVVTAMGIKRSEKALGYAATSVGGEKIAAFIRVISRLRRTESIC